MSILASIFWEKTMRQGVPDIIDASDCTSYRCGYFSNSVRNCHFFHQKCFVKYVMIEHFPPLGLPLSSERKPLFRSSKIIVTNINRQKLVYTCVLRNDISSDKLVFHHFQISRAPALCV